MHCWTMTPVAIATITMAGVVATAGPSGGVHDPDELHHTNRPTIDRRGAFLTERSPCRLGIIDFDIRGIVCSVL